MNSDQYSEKFVKMWDQLVNWPERQQKEKNFLINRLQQTDRVLDIAAGTGFHVVHLLQNNISVDGLDFSENMLAQCRANIEAAGITPPVLIKENWLTISNSVAKNSYSAVICLGNAFAHLMSEGEQRQAITISSPQLMNLDTIYALGDPDVREISHPNNRVVQLTHAVTGDQLSTTTHCGAANGDHLWQ